MKPEDLTPEQIDRAKSCQTPEDLLEFVKNEGVELPEEQLDQIAGGGWTGHQCPRCGSYDVEPVLGYPGLICSSCGYGEK